MKVIVLWENQSEQALAANLVAVLRKIGDMLVYGKVNDKGVLLEDWASKPRVKMECVAGPAPSTPVERVGFTYEMPFDGVSYGPPVFTRSQPKPGTLGITRELMRDLVRMFPNDDKAIDKTAKRKRKPVVPKPDTTETGVTVRQLDMWEEDDHGNHTD
jgi:hypothetical protein